MSNINKRNSNKVVNQSGGDQSGGDQSVQRKEHRSTNERLGEEFPVVWDL